MIDKVSKEALSLHPIPLPTKAWSINNIGLKETVSSSKYIVSEWSAVASIPDKSASSVA